MKTLRKYTAGFLLILVLFPQVYQAIHVLRHHRYTAYQPHYLHNRLIPFELKNNCPLLQFQFFLSYKAPETKTDGLILYVASIICEKIFVFCYSYFRGNNADLRAPPATIAA
ncbi:MAG: hypothetical protein ACPLXM_00850 [Bacteroidales bacterium]